MIHRIDMIHHNPGERPFDTCFTDPATLVKHRFNGQAFKHINTVATFGAVAPGVFPSTAEEHAWLAAFTAARDGEIRQAKAAGLEVYYHIDLFVLPMAVVECYRSEICDPATGRISLRREKTLELHRALFAEIFARWPEIDGLIIRVGETYLMDTPHHIGNGVVDYSGKTPSAVMQEDFRRLLGFLREEVCVRHGRRLIHRTWDTHSDKFHADRGFYLAVTDEIEPHPNLLFSIKHTAFDFHRFTPLNPCLGHGRHRQIVEVQCQREYEGKGAYPNYIARGVIEGFVEVPDCGLSEYVNHPLCAGLYTWSRGGGWYGPELDRRNEFWCELNFAVMAAWAQEPSRPESEHFATVCRAHFGLSAADTAVLREIALRSEVAILEGKCCAVYDGQHDPVAHGPSNLWMRDDVLHGYDRLDPVFAKVREVGGDEAAVSEKVSAVRRWEGMRELAERFSPEMDAGRRKVILVSIEHGVRLFSAVAEAWRVLLAAHGSWARGEAVTDPAAVLAGVDRFLAAWAHYEHLSTEFPEAPTLYRSVGWSWPGKGPAPGLMDSVLEVKRLAEA